MTKICCFTGHREFTTMSNFEVALRLEEKLIGLIEIEEFSDFRAGGAIGFDSIAALTVLRLKEKYPHIKLHLLLPCKTQDKYFTPFERKIYKYTIENADSVTYIQEKYTRDAMFARNRALVEGSDLCLAFLERLSGGTYQTVNYARRRNVRTINLAKK